MEENILQQKEKVFVSWSGGKDAYLALQLAQEQGLEVGCLLNFQSENGQSRSHGLSQDILCQQAALLGIPLEGEAVSWGTYEKGFDRAVERLKYRGFTGGVFGDINLEEHRQWIEKKCQENNVKSYLPLWGMKERRVTEEFLQREGRALLVSLKNELVSENWLGKIISPRFLDYCESRGLSPCGERGEFHTLVIDGAGFHSSLKYRIDRVEREKGLTRLLISLRS